MLKQEAYDVLSWALVGVPLLAIGLWLFRRGTLRARHLVYGYQPLSIMLANLVLATSHSLRSTNWSPLSTWGARLLFSFIVTVLVMMPALIVLRIKGVDIDEWDRKRGK